MKSTDDFFGRTGGIELLGEATDDERRSAALYVCDQAHDVDDARGLLEMELLGLLS